MSVRLKKIHTIGKRVSTWRDFIDYCEKKKIKIDQIGELDLGYHNLKNWENCPAFPNLKILNIQFNQINTFKGCPIFPNIEKINLSNNKLTSLINFPAFANLQLLYLDNNQIKSFYGLPPLNTLKKLSISSNPISTWKRIPVLPQLQHLDIDDTLIRTWDRCPIFHKVISLYTGHNHSLNRECYKFPILKYTSSILDHDDTVSDCLIKFMFGRWESYHDKLLELSLVFYKLPTYIICHIFDYWGCIKTDTSKDSFSFWRHADKIKLISNVKKSVECIKH